MREHVDPACPLKVRRGGDSHPEPHILSDQSIALTVLKDLVLKNDIFSYQGLGSVGYAQTIPGYVFTPGITLQKTSVSCLGHSYPCPELLEALYDVHTRARSFWKFRMPVPQIPGVRVYNFLQRV